MPKPPRVPVLQLSDLHFAHPGQPPLFDGLSLRLPAGLTLLHGDTGSGKTSLLRLLAGELQGQGSLVVDGVDQRTHPAGYRQRVGWIDPRDPAWDALTPHELMAAQRALHPGLDEAMWRRHAQGFELGPHLAKPMAALSTGSRRKAALAVALAGGSALMLLDTPGAGLDASSLSWLLRALASIAGRPGQAVLATAGPGLDSLPRAAEITLPDPPPQR